MELTPFIPLKLLRHSEKVQQMLAGERVYPISVEIDLSNICNHSCPWCSFNGFRQENWKSWDGARMLSLLGELAAVGVKSITFTGGGEPLVHQQAAEIFQRCADLGMQFGIVTNGRRLEGPVVDVIAKHAVFVRVSLDAGTTQTHQMLHATATPEYERILNNMGALRVLSALSRETQPTIGASFCVFDVNRHEIGMAAERVKTAGADYLEVRPVFPTEWRGGGFGNPLTEEHIDDARANLDAAKATYNGDGFRVIGMIERFDQVFNRAKDYESCHIGPLTTVINADGYIYHCCQQRGMPNFRAGSVLNAPFAEVWWNAQHQAMVDAIDISKCGPCRYDGYNRIVEQAFQADALHANFI
jgi:radical SAM protein with 4Fe4S-binding SPASM domain